MTDRHITDFVNNTHGSWLLKGQEFHWRHIATDADLQLLDGAMDQSVEAPGFHNLILYWEHSQRFGWIIIFDNEGNLAGFSIANYQPGFPKLSFGGLNCVLSKYRQFGLGKLLYPTESFGNSTLDAMKFITKSRSTSFGFKSIRLFGTPRPTKHLVDLDYDGNRKFRLMDLCDTNANVSELIINALLDYDSQFPAPLQRRNFIKSWTTVFHKLQKFPHQKTVIAIADPTNLANTSKSDARNIGDIAEQNPIEILGYGTLRGMERAYILAPLYAETPAVARALLRSLLTPVTEGFVNYIFPLATDGDSSEARVPFEVAVRGFGLEIQESYTRTYFTETGDCIRYDRSRAWSKVYANQDIWSV